MMIIGKGIPSPHGLRLIIGIHEGFLPFPVGDGLFKYTSDCFALITIIGNPIHAFSLGKSIVFAINVMVA